MPVVQSEDSNEKVHHPRHYNQHPSGIECIDLIEHLPCNLANAFKYIWRCGLKASEEPIRDLRSARWYVEREIQRMDLFEIPHPNKVERKASDIVWRFYAKRIVSMPGASLLQTCLACLIAGELSGISRVLAKEIARLGEAP